MRSCYVVVNIILSFNDNIFANVCVKILLYSIVGDKCEINTL